MNNISEEHQEQVIKFIKFFRGKRELALEQIQCDFDDTKNDHLQEDMYTMDEVHGAFDSMCHVVKDTTRSELGSVINMTVLLLAQLFESADDQGAELEMDTSSVEDQRMLEEVEKMTLDKSTTGKGKGARLKDTLAQTKKDLMQAESDRDLAKDQYKSASKKLKKEREKVAKMVQELAELRALNGGGGKLSADEEKGEDEEEKGDEEEKEDTVDLSELPPSDLIKKCKAYKKKMVQLKADMETKLSESKPFQQMKKMMTTKNRQLSACRERLRLHEPDWVEEQDM